MTRQSLRGPGIVGSFAILYSGQVAAQVPKPPQPPPPMTATMGAPRAAAPPPVAAPAPQTRTPTPPPFIAPAPQAPMPRELPSAAPLAAAPQEAPEPIADSSPSTASPRFVKLLPSRYDRDEITIAVDQELRLAVVVEHPDGKALRMQALGLPQRASFDPQLRSVTWRPTEAELGSYQVRFVVSDGVRESSRTVLISVAENRAPVLGSVWFETPAGQPATWFIDAKDPEMAAVAFDVEGLPKGAILDGETGRIDFTPENSQVGQYPIVVHASDGQKSATARGTIVVRPAEQAPSTHDEWTSFLLPGVGYSIYSPRDAASTVFHGLNLEVVVAAWIHRNDNRGPSHGRVYINAELLNATGLHVPLMFAYSTGMSLSFERNPQRNWLIPHYGLEVGGIVHHDLGAFFQTTPYAGLHLFSSPNVFLGARLGYRLIPSKVNDLSGVHFGVLADLSIW